LKGAVGEGRAEYLSGKSRKYVVVDACYTRINNHKTTFQIGS
jgi:hypothetical protein